MNIKTENGRAQIMVRIAVVQGEEKATFSSGLNQLGFSGCQAVMPPDRPCTSPFSSARLIGPSDL